MGEGAFVNREEKQRKFCVQCGDMTEHTRTKALEGEIQPLFTCRGPEHQHSSNDMTRKDLMDRMNRAEALATSLGERLDVCEQVTGAMLVVLGEGTDAESDEVIGTLRRELTQMQAWLEASRGKAPKKLDPPTNYEEQLQNATSTIQTLRDDLQILRSVGMQLCNETLNGHFTGELNEKARNLIKLCNIK